MAGGWALETDDWLDLTEHNVDSRAAYNLTSTRPRRSASPRVPHNNNPHHPAYYEIIFKNNVLPKNTSIKLQ